MFRQNSHAKRENVVLVDGWWSDAGLESSIQLQNSDVSCCAVSCFPLACLLLRYIRPFLSIHEQWAFVYRATHMQLWTQINKLNFNFKMLRYSFLFFFFFVLKRLRTWESSSWHMFQTMMDRYDFFHQNSSENYSIYLYFFTLFTLYVYLYAW